MYLHDKRLLLVCDSPLNVDGFNIRNFTGCTDIKGSLSFSDFYLNAYVYLMSLLNAFLSILCCRDSGTNRPQVNQSDLEVAFKSVRTVSGYVRVATLRNEPRFTSMKFLRNLETIGGDELQIFRFSLLVFSTGFYNLGLESLKSITKGDILLSFNSKLCLNLTQEGLRKGGVIAQSQSALIGNNNVSCGKLTPCYSRMNNYLFII